jgi:hypothetical protein
MSSEAIIDDSADSLSRVSSLDNDLATMHLASASSDEEVTDDEIDSHVWSEIDSESDGVLLEDHGIVEQVTRTSQSILSIAIDISSPTRLLVLWFTKQIDMQNNTY